MERLEIRYKDTVKALATLESVLKEPFSIIVRDATIQRFEYTFESLWKFLKEYLKEKEGIICNSPKACFRELLGLGLLNEEETVMCLDMTDRRNETSHTYMEEVAEKIYSKIESYSILIRNILSRIKNKI